MESRIGFNASMGQQQEISALLRSDPNPMSHQLTQQLFFFLAKLTLLLGKNYLAKLLM